MSKFDCYTHSSSSSISSSSPLSIEIVVLGVSSVSFGGLTEDSGMASVNVVSERNSLELNYLLP